MIDQCVTGCRSISEPERSDRLFAQSALFKIRKPLVSPGSKRVIEEPGRFRVYTVIFVIIYLRSAASSLGKLYAVLGRKLLNSLNEREPVIFLHEADDVSRLAAAEAVIELFSFVDTERRCLFRMERT